MNIDEILEEVRTRLTSDSPMNGTLDGLIETFDQAIPFPERFNTTLNVVLEERGIDVDTEPNKDELISKAERLAEELLAKHFGAERN